MGVKNDVADYFRRSFTESGALTRVAMFLTTGHAGLPAPRRLLAWMRVLLACELNLVAVDHCTYLSDADVAALAESGTVATLLPGVEFSTRSPYPDARRLVEAGVHVAIATDCNPGSSYTSSMPLCVALAVREMRMTPAEALLAATRGGAAALGLEYVGNLAVGARADLVVLDAPSYVHLAYRPGVPLVREVFVGGSLLT